MKTTLWGVFRPCLALAVVVALAVVLAWSRWSRWSR
jgi:hypothetical protein